MDAIDRRDVLRTLIGGAVTVGLASSSLLPDMAEATPLAMQKDPGRNAGDFVQEAQADRRPGRPPHRPPPHRPRPPHHRHRRRRRWVCWWHRGRRHCGWRWV